MRTLRQNIGEKSVKAYNMGYTDGTMGRISREKRYFGQDFVAYVAGYAHGYDATQQIFSIAG